ncbi:hypothetical protein [Streptomyces cinerochromogenes]|uniref:hypothetical protein n=1 Tax=Streptomyces cinerochromogenes TaxID=66422 RepID=UPI0016713EB1|nr:hypothetical protein [Streptomyces cinerochromogenes]GGS50965.1 hypothetical protein GCM10010206_10680 [Streptomyces cinerochromogenes]
MTQSGQGEEPSARPAREGIVLPSDGGEPLLPGMTATPAPAGPAGGQAWDGSWGPGRQAPPEQGQGHASSAAPQWTGSQQPPSAANPGPLPPEGAPAPSYGGQAPAYGGPGTPYGGGQPAPGGYEAAQQSAYGAPDAYQQHQAQQAPHAQQPYPPAAAPLPPTADGATQYLPPVPAASADGATQYIPPVQAGPADGATQYIPPVPADPAAASVHEAATQYLPPVTPGALPPESAGEETRYLGQVPRQAAPAPSDAEATQYIPPYTAQAQAQGQGQGADRQPPAEFDNLFRGGPAGGDGPAGSTQQLPRVQQPDAYPGPGPVSYRPAQSSYDEGAYDDGGGGRRGARSRVPLIAAVGVGLVVLGVGAGALLSAGGDKGKGGDDKTVAAASPATQDSASPTVDPAREQAVELDKLLADSGSSRSSVIQAVSDVRRCDNLDRAAADLRDAAGQRGQLVTRLGKLSVDKLPGNADLTAALTKAWQASAAADNHYAAWADQAKNRKVCHKGHARTTGETQAGNRESTTASAQKAKAAALWNTIAQKYGLTQRQPTQL